MLQTSKNIILNNSMSKLKKSIKETFNELYVKNGNVIKIDFKINEYLLDENEYDNEIDDNFLKLSKSISCENKLNTKIIIYNNTENNQHIFNANDNNELNLDKTESQSTNSSLSLSFILIDIDEHYSTNNCNESWYYI